MSGRAVMSDVGSSHTVEVKTTDVGHFDSPKATGPLVCMAMCLHVFTVFSSSDALWNDLFELKDSERY